MIGQQSLTAALSNGKLSAQSDAKFDPAVTEKLIAVFGKSGRMASAALDSASSAKFPGAIADTVGPMIDRAKAGFKVTGKGAWVQSFAETYGGGLLTQAGQHGPEFLAGLPSYLDSGAQFSKGAAGATGATFNEAMANRSRKLAGALIKPDGTIDVTSPGSTEAVGHLLYHPDVMKNPTPGLSDNVLNTVKMLKDPVTGPQASTVLKGVTAPTDAAGLALVRTSLAEGPTGAVDAGGTQVAVLMAMLQPFTQGAVGSCFSTGPLRRQREIDPLTTMKSYAKLASKGTFQPGVGAELPAVTNLPPGENPLMRSLEYTVASAGARLTDSNRRALLGSDIAQGTDLLQGAATKGVTTDADKVWRTKQQKLAKDVADALTFTYDPTVNSGPSRDGSSSKGRYMVVYKNASISTKEEFQNAMLEVAIASLGITAGSDVATDVELVVRSDAFATKVCPRAGQAPWQLSSGGSSRNTLEVLKGSKAAETTVIAAATDPKPTEGERTKAVLAGLLKQFRGSTAQMATIDTVGQHTFNILPNDPSLAALKGANDTETQQKMQTALIDKGLAMKDKILTAERAAWLFDKAIKAEAGLVTDPALKALVEQGSRANRPVADMKPAAVTAAVKAALDAYDDKLAENATVDWKNEQVLAGKTVNTTQEAAEKLKLKLERQEASGVAAKTATMADLDAPQFVIADTNWGDSTNTVKFVIAPDPDNGRTDDVEADGTAGFVVSCRARLGRSVMECVRLT